MKKNIIGTMALTAATLLMIGCGESTPKEESAPKVDSTPKEKRAPECGSNDVKNMIIDGFSTKSTEQTKGYFESNKKRLVKLEQQLKQKNDKYLKNNIERSRKTIAEQEAIVKNGYKFNLKRILTESVDDRAQKSVCKAELHTITGGKHYIWDVGYTAQYTSDGELVIDMKRFKNFNLDWIFRVKSVTDVKPKKRTSHNVESDENNIIKQGKTVNNKETKSNNIVSNTPQSTSFKVEEIGVVYDLDPNDDGFLSLRVKPKSTEIGKLYNGDRVEILDRSGKYYKVKDLKSSKIGWAHSNWIKRTLKEDSAPKVDSSVSNTLKCTYFKVTGVRQLNLRDKPGKPSKIVGKVNMNESVCVYDLTGKWGRTDRGWISMKYLSQDYKKSNFLLADIDNDGKKERLQWDNIPNDNPEMEVYQLKLFDNDNRLLWEGPRENIEDDPLIVGYKYVSGRMPVIFDDIDGDGSAELILSSPPHEGTSPGSEIYRWTGKNFIRTSSPKYLDLVWIDAPNGKTLKWTKIDDKDYSKRKKIWWVGEFFQMPNNELPIVEIAGVQYPQFSAFFRSKAKIRFTPTGAVIEEWIK